jgi:diacylglycerol kinase family enzyme
MQESLEKGGRFVQWLSEILYGLLFALAVASVFFNRKVLNQRYEAVCDGKRFTGSFRGISIFNSPFYGGDKHPLPCAMPNDGRLDMLLTTAGGILRTFMIFPFFMSGRYAECPEFTYQQVRQVEIHSDAPLQINLDGEVFFDTEFSLELLPAALKFADATGHGYGGGGGGR